jgi:hypothetical protein
MTGGYPQLTRPAWGSWDGYNSSLTNIDPLGFRKKNLVGIVRTITFEGRWVGYLEKIVKYIHMIVLYILGFLVSLALVMGYIKAEEISFGLEINTLQTPFYKLGITSQRFILEDGTSEDELLIGLFFINIVIVFWKPGEEE